MLNGTKLQTHGPTYRLFQLEFLDIDHNVDTDRDMNARLPS